MWLDQDHGGVLRVLTTSDFAVAPYIRALADRSHVRTRTVAHSRAELDGIVSRLERTVGGGPDSLFIPAVSMMENKVVLWRRDWVADAKRSGTWNKLSNVTGRPAATAAARTAAVAHELAHGRAALAAQPRGLVEERRLDQPQQAFTPYVDWGYCHPLYCSTKYGPMRGGLRLNIKRDNGTWGGCTSGFNIRSKGGTTYNNWAWVLTAGHCVVGKTNNTYINHNGYSILQQHAPNAALEVNSYPYDFVMLPSLRFCATCSLRRSGLRSYGDRCPRTSGRLRWWRPICCEPFWVDDDEGKPEQRLGGSPSRRYLGVEPPGRESRVPGRKPGLACEDDVFGVVVDRHAERPYRPRRLSVAH
ncbi:hypothetical protein AB0I54_46615 [Streptomyces sp. NPDC050625]|uniref:hypothetical protein n=1 Tax=Streptomyces sp. NPDC050625 TaxID=3154629 RepID=UPI003439310E